MEEFDYVSEMPESVIVSLSRLDQISAALSFRYKHRSRSYQNGKNIMFLALLSTHFVSPSLSLLSSNCVCSTYKP
jgi:hypothetical protein